MYIQFRVIFTLICWIFNETLSGRIGALLTRLSARSKIIKYIDRTLSLLFKAEIGKRIQKHVTKLNTMKKRISRTTTSLVRS